MCDSVDGQSGGGDSAVNLRLEILSGPVECCYSGPVNEM